MKKCQNCGFENKATARFCVKCGGNLEKRCPACGNVLGEVELYCSVCGARTDGKIFCTACGTQNDGENLYCADCGAALSRTPAQRPGVQPVAQPAPAKNKPPKAATAASRNAKRIADRVLSIVRASVVMALAIVMFIMSFFSVHKMNVGEITSEMGYSSLDSVMVDFSSIDVIEGAFAFADPDTMEEKILDFKAFVVDHTSETEQKILDNAYTNTLQATAILARMVEKYNVFRFMAIDEITDYAPAAVTELWISAALSLLYIAASGVFLVFSVIDFIQTLRKKNRPKGLLKSNLLLLASAIGFAFILTMTFEGRAGFGLTTILVLSIISLVLEIGCRIFVGELKFSKAKLFNYISAGAGAVIVLVMLLLAGTPLIKVLCEYTIAYGNAPQTFRSGYNATDLADAWNFLETFRNDSEMLGSAGTFIPEAFSYFGDSTLEKKMALSPALMGILGNLEVEVPLAIIGMLIYLLCLGLIVCLALSFADYIKAAGSDKSPKLLYGILTSSFAAALLIATVAYAAMVNMTIEGTEKVVYRASLSAALILVFIFALIDLAQRIVFKILNKNKTRAAAAQQMPQIPQMPQRPQAPGTYAR